ncbi:type II toxin-antitoxin system PemK/MazF family toxin [Microbacterium stercoris]|uniref:Type II toxin-antitoxin system PemK/MazF family toxin n=1 Tax=Microbacterium stercoris TaxID=2820289 RepID=A0A939TRM1_9MICO|nr:type II toxin-antitoxin system PemK/MazF family toxin [Microbacterium stercoris]MBO3664291.1 type II toxin-antitoxin system PemK/MazF family toxin [Microbacterium stercoris]MBO3664530.1 type II toxin-antitoxin system PemK/MazF family toxin [Microbacterium stercoris]
MAGKGILGAFAKLVLGAVETATRRPSGQARPGGTGSSGSRGGRGSTPSPRPANRDDDASRAPVPESILTVEVRPDDVRDLRLEYAPSMDGDPDAGEIVWTWVPYAENDGRGKDRPVLIVARQSGRRLYAVKLTSRSHDGDREYLSIGRGDWDSAGRESWVDLDQLYSVHADGMRREAASLDLDRFARVASALQRRYGWTAGR